MSTLFISQPLIYILDGKSSSAVDDKLSGKVVQKVSSHSAHNEGEVTLQGRQLTARLRARSHPAAKLNIYFHVISKEPWTHCGTLSSSSRKNAIKIKGNETFQRSPPPATVQHFKTNCIQRSSQTLAAHYLMFVGGELIRFRSHTERERENKERAHDVQRLNWN